EIDRVLRHAGAQRTARAADEQDGAERGLAIVLDQPDRLAKSFRKRLLDRLQRLVELEIGVLLAGGRHHQKRKAGAGALLRIPFPQDRQRVVDRRAAPAEPRLRYLEVASGRGLPPQDAYAC